jgi:molecular chaperone DnaK
MALQLGLRRGLLASNGVNSSLARSTISKSSFGGISQMRMKSTDAGDVIGIDLGTTNSCVAIMVRFKTDIM